MFKIFAGLLLVFLDFNLIFVESLIDVLPDFLGYIIVYLGLKDLSDHAPSFNSAKIICFIMCIYSISEFWCSLLGLLSIFSYTAILGSIGYLSLNYMIIKGIKEIEENINIDLDSYSLLQSWKYLSLFTIVAFLTFMSSVLTSIFSIIAFVFTIIYLYRLYKTTKMFLNRPQ